VAGSLKIRIFGIFAKYGENKFSNRQQYLWIYGQLKKKKELLNLISGDGRTSKLPTNSGENISFLKYKMIPGLLLLYFYGVFGSTKHVLLKIYDELRKG